MAAGAIVLLIVIFSAGWVVTSGSAKAEARLMAGQAVLDRLAPIAIAQFMQDPNKEERLKELKKLDSYGMNNRTDYVKKQGCRRGRRSACEAQTIRRLAHQPGYYVRMNGRNNNGKVVCNV
jgi:hypothetical protein